jgi:glucose-6-phosphate-specific signal transduction histidine kinase
MNRAAQILVWGGVAFLWPMPAHAQRIPTLAIVLALMPLLGVILSIMLGALKRSWLVGLGNLGLVALWVAWFVAAAQFSKSDLMNWAPIGVSGFHLVGMLFLIGLHAFHRLRGRR